VKRLLLASILLSGCNWVTQKNFEQRSDELDDDGDGFTRDGGGDSALVDCDDANSEIHPGADEVWYDGVDSDCAGDDDFDQDGDGQQSQTEADGTDCDDTNPTIFLDAPDAWYDGVDSDCAGNNDFDQDGDGQSSASQTSEGTDCNDIDAEVYLGADETWYDGVDSDCAGDDDFDQDGDGQRAQAHTVDGEDCDDIDDTIYLGADDEWYDGVDSDCAGDDDFDQDVDGYRSAIETGDGDDCDDSNADVNPGALEDLSDISIDHDCDGAGDSIAMWWDSVLSWEDIGSIHLGETTDRIYLSITAERFTDSSNTTYYDIGVAPYWSKSNLDDLPAGVEFWSSTDLVETSGRFVTTGHAVRFEDDRIYGVMGIIDTDSSVIRNLRLYRNILSTSEQESVAVGITGVSADLVDIGFLKDDTGNYHVVGCDPTSNGTFQYVLTNDAHLDDGLSGNFLHQQSFNGLARPYGCVAGTQASGSSPQLWFADNNNSSNLRYATLNENASDSSGISISVNQTFIGTTVEDIDHLVTTTSESWVVMTDSASNQISLKKNLNELGPLSTGSIAPMAIDLAEDTTNGRMWIAWTDAIFGAHIAWADSSGFLGSAVLNTSIQAEDIAIAIPDGGEKAVVIVAGDSQVEMTVIQLP